MSGMKDVAKLLNELRASGIIVNYALFGATAQMRYTEPVATLDADVLIAVPEPNRIDVLEPIYAFCATKGFHAEGEAIRVGAWPVQFIPVFDRLTREAMEQADTVDFEGEPLRVVRADHLAAIALGTGRTKDSVRILTLLEADSVTPEEIADLAEEHGLAEAWSRFKTRFLSA